MRKLFTFLLSAGLLVAGCAKPVLTEVPPPVFVAVQQGLPMPDPLSAPDKGGINRGHVEDPLEYLKAHPDAVAITSTESPAGLISFIYKWDEVVLMQHFLEYQRSLSMQEAFTAVNKAGPPGTPKLGELAKGHLSDLKPGWKPVAVSGVMPTPETIADGTYPLTHQTYVVYRPDASDRVLKVVNQIKAMGDKAPTPWVKLSVTGDFMLARGVGRAMRENGTLYPVDQVKEHLAAADLTFVNLESPIGVTGKPLPGKQIWFRAAPEAIDILKAAGVDVVTVANNHILDYDSENFLETLSLLEKANIKYTGGGRNAVEARRPVVADAKGVKVAFLGYSEFADLFFDFGYPRSFTATDKLPGVNRLAEQQIAEDIRLARQQADIVVVAPHWGVEFENYPTEQQRELAHRMIDLGADLVLGSHPHAIQGFELYNGKFIAYSMGNFIMDRQDTDLARESMILDIYLSKEGVRSVSVHPVWIKAEQPYIMTGKEGAELLKKMQVISGWK